MHTHTHTHTHMCVCMCIYAALYVNSELMLSLFRQRFTVKSQLHKSTKILRFMSDKRTQRSIKFNFLFEEKFANLRCSGVIEGHVHPS